MPSAASIVSLAFTMLSLLAFANLWTRFLPGDLLPLSLISYVLGVLFAVLSLFTRDHTLVARLARILPVVIFCLGLALTGWISRGIDH